MYDTETGYLKRTEILCEAEKCLLGKIYILYLFVLSQGQKETQ